MTRKKSLTPLEIPQRNLQTDLSQNKPQVKRTIRKIAPIKVMAGYHGKIITSLLCVGLFFLLFVGIGMISFGVDENDITCIILAISLTCLLSGTLFFLFRGSKYVPNKSFFGCRWTKEKLQRITKLLIPIAIVLLVVVFTINIISEGIGKALSQSFIVIGVFLVPSYYLLKSIKVHGDVDYVANDALLEVAEVKVDEKVIASYQNFDNTKSKYKKKDNIIVVTNRKIFFAVFNGTNWLKLNKTFSDIYKIGIGRKELSDCYLKLVFFDNTTLGLRLDLYDKITTTPQLFLKQFLNALDSYLLGQDAVPTTSRRRITVSTEQAGEQSVTQTVAPAVRKIELNTTISKAIKEAEEVKPGRILEF
jgi:hypothetical protein